jgi:FkbM family methyltransferase
MIQHRGIWLPDGEQHLLPHINNGPLVGGKGTYQYAKLELAVRHHTRGRNRALDIGAHVGLWSRVLAERFRYVEAFEPVPLHQDLYRRNMAHAKNWTLHECALGQTLGEAMMTLYREHSMAAHIGASRLGAPKYEGLHTAGEVTVPVKTLDSFAFEDVDFIKIDCEGAELQVLKGARETIERWKPTLIVEQKPGNGSRFGYGDRDAIAWLETLGAKMVAEKAGDYVFVWR